MSRKKIIITDRYGGNYPNLKTMCPGQCEGTGWIPRSNKPWVKCPTCGGTGKRKTKGGAK